MCEIEFRGKCVKTGKWVYGGFHKHQLITPSPIISREEKPPKIEYVCLIIESGFSDWELPKPIIGHAVIPKTVGQYAGLKDKNETRVYRGDIVQLDDVNSWCSCGWNHSRCEFAWYLKNKDYLCPIGDIRTRLKVVGNIYDNPKFTTKGGKSINA